MLSFTRSPETTNVVSLGYLSSINGLSSDLQPAQDPINSQTGTASLPTLFYSETLITRFASIHILLFLHVQHGLAGYVP
jgi:hypothetical protein